MKLLELEYGILLFLCEQEGSTLLPLYYSHKNDHDSFVLVLVVEAESGDGGKVMMEDCDAK